MSESEKLQQITEIVRQFAEAYYNQKLSWQVEQMLIGAEVPFATGEQLMQSGEAQEWLIMAKAAVGLLEYNEENAGYIYEICQSMAEWLFSVPLSYTYVPARWRATPMGQLWAAASIWCQGDQLITITEAAELRGVTTQAISNAIRDCRLTGYKNPDAANPQKGGTLVSRREVEDV